MNSKVKIVLSTLMILSLLNGCGKVIHHSKVIKIKSPIYKSQKNKSILFYMLPSLKIQRKNPVRKFWNVPMNRSQQLYLSKICKTYGVGERLAYAVIKKESDFKPFKISMTQDYGLFQINRVHKQELRQQLGITNLLDPYQNIHAGVYMLSNLKKKYHDESKILLAYHLGETGMKRSIQNGVYETQYTIDVINNMNRLSVS